jgi:calcineurin-like phosphoesterase family protein
MRTFFTSDTHFYHGNIILYCNRTPWLKPEDTQFNEELQKTIWKSKGRSRFRAKQMTEDMIALWNSTVTNDDIVYHLGDFAFGEDAEVLDVLYRLNFKMLYYVWGNHDAVMHHIHHQRGSQKYLSLTNRIYWLGPQAEIEIDDQLIVLNHYAMKVWNQSHRGSWHLYGHSHGGLPDDPHSRSIDVGVDCFNYKPVSFEEVKAIMAKKLWEPIDRHGKKNGQDGMSREEYAKAQRRNYYEQLKKEFGQ